MVDSFDEKAIWNQIRLEMESNWDIPDHESMRGFLGFLNPEMANEDSLMMSIKSEWAKKRIVQSYKKYLDAAYSQIVGHPAEVIIVVSPEEERAPVEDRVEPAAAYAQNAVEYQQNVVPSSQQNVNQQEDFHGFHNGHAGDMQPLSELSTVFTTETESVDSAPQKSTESSGGTKSFDSFIVADTNNTAYGTAMAVADNPGEMYNPLFIYGRSGLGKTHLLLAIKDYVEKNQPSKKVTYAPTTSLIESYVDALGTGDWTEFTSLYRNADVLLLDDIQYLEGAEETTNEFFKIFNKMAEQKKQIVLAADRAPKEINLDERIKSRFANGVTADIQAPKFETKLKIFQNNLDYLRERNPGAEIFIPQDVIFRVVELSNSNIRNLEGAAATLSIYIIHGREHKEYPITVAEAEEVVSKIFFSSVSQKITISDIQRFVEKYYKVSHDELLGPQRPKNVSTARQVGMYLSRTLAQKSFPQIGEAFKKNHTSAVHACKNIEDRRQASKEFNDEIERISDMIVSSVEER